MSFCPTAGHKGPGRPPRRKTAEDFALPKPKPLPERPEPDGSYELLSEFAGRHVDPDEPRDLLALVWELAAGFAKWDDAEADHEWRQVMRRVAMAVENRQPECLRAAVVGAVKSLESGFPTPAEQTRRQARARRQARRQSADSADDTERD